MINNGPISDSGPGSTPTWQAVMTAGNTSNLPAIFTNIGGQSIAKNGDAFGFGAGSWIIANAGNANPMDPTTGAGIFAYVLPAAGAEAVTIGFFNSINGGVETTYLVPRINTTRRHIYMPDATGETILGNSDVFTQVATAGQVTIVIPHGMWPLPDFSITPRNSIIQSLNPATAQVLVGGYSMSYDNTNMYIHLLVAIAGVPALAIGWTAIV